MQEVVQALELVLHSVGRCGWLLSYVTWCSMQAQPNCMAIRSRQRGVSGLSCEGGVSYVSPCVDPLQVAGL